MEAITDLDLLDKNGNETYFDPIMISNYDFYHKKLYNKILNYNWKERNELVSTKILEESTDKIYRKVRIDSLKTFFLEFTNKKYHKFVLYAHNFSSFDGILILESLVYLCEDQGFKIEPLIRDNKIISLKIRFGKTSQGRYYITFHDSLLILLSSLDKLAKTFLKDHPDLQKINDKYLLECLLYKNHRKAYGDIRFLRELAIYCERDSISLAHIINRFSIIIYDLYKLNIHDYPTVSSLAMAIYLTHYLKNDNLIPLISGEIYRDIAKSYHGGHTDVYRLYSNEKVYSYDFVSMYPTQMLNQNMPVGKITKFIGNPLNMGDTLKSLSDQLAFIKCSIYVDKSLNRPVYQTLVNINGELRSVCATGIFLNQWVFVPELMKYQELTNGLTRIIPESIQMGYLFESKIMFKDFIEHLFRMKNSVTKKDPLYQISKILMNSLYGRMGLRQELTEYKFMDKLDIEKFSFKEDVTIADIIEFNESSKSLVVTIKNSDQITLKSSVAIAAAITAYARMSMAPILLDENLDILYIDTDSFKSTQKIIEIEKYKYLNHDYLGGLKYEYTLNESIYLAPKMYGGFIENTEFEFSKVKGFKDQVEFLILKNLLLNQKELILSQNKWRRDMLNSEIKIMKSPYNVSLNENKRIIDLKTLTTKPYHFECYDPESKENQIK